MSGRQVLALYRRIFRVARQWRAAIPADTEAERQYIKDEARQLFRKNKNITNTNEIMLCIHEANARVEMGLHYGTPYPRMIHMPPTAVPKTNTKERKTQERIRKQAKPVYMHSDDDVDR